MKELMGFRVRFSLSLSLSLFEPFENLEKGRVQNGEECDVGKEAERKKRVTEESTRTVFVRSKNRIQR
jgi:hypothetical protein